MSSILRRRLMMQLDKSSLGYCVYETGEPDQFIEIAATDLAIIRVEDIDTGEVHYNRKPTDPVYGNYINAYLQNAGKHRIKITLDPNATDASYMFYNNIYIQEIDPYLFKNSPNILTFESCFEAAALAGEMPQGLFSENKKATSFLNCFYYQNGLKGSTPKDAAGELWQRAGKAGYPKTIDGTFCFAGCTGLSNFNKIPEEWK